MKLVLFDIDGTILTSGMAGSELYWADTKGFFEPLDAVNTKSRQIPRGTAR